MAKFDIVYSTISRMFKLLSIIGIIFFSGLVGLQAQVWSPDGKKIAFFYIHNIEDIYSVNADGSDFQILDDHPERDFAPCWSPSGKHLLFTSVRDGHHEIYRINQKGKGLRKLTETEFDSEDGFYSPDGKQIVFTSNRTGNREIYIMDHKGRNIRQITDTETQETTARWSPDGQKILFRHTSALEKPADLFVMNVDGTNRRQLTDTPASEFHQSWSPDGKRICFVRAVDQAFEIHVMDSDGGDSKVLVSKKGHQAFYPNWSADGRYIAFTRDVMEGTASGLPALFVVDMDGNERLISDQNSFP